MEKKRKEDYRFRAFLGVTIVIFLVLAARLFSLQILKAEVFQARAKENTVRLSPLPAPRGEILDRKGRVLATSRPEFVVTISKLAGEKEASPAVIAKLASLLNDPEISAATIKAKLQAQPRPYLPVEIKRMDWSPEAWQTIAKIEEHRHELPGVNIQIEPVRFYPQGELAGHVLGYLGKIFPEELASYLERGYKRNDWVGKAGIEKTMERYGETEPYHGLQGQDGASQVEVNANGHPVSELTTIPPAPGDNVTLTLDLELQKSLEEALAEAVQIAKKKNPKAGSGGAVVLDVRNGEILALASQPAINPNDFVAGKGLSREQQAYYFGPATPFRNRVTQGTYHPGSTFKMITGMAALSKGAITPESTVTCTGAYWQAPFIRCWGIHGRVNLYRAYAVSCNTFFQHAGYLAGVDEIVRVACEFGLGEKTGLRDLPGEESGLLPSPAWKKETGSAAVNKRYQEKRKACEEKYAARLAKAKTLAERSKIEKEKEAELRQLEAWYQIDYNFETTWHPFDTFNLSIGQGAGSYTLLQLANYVATLANGGKRWQPYLVQKITSPEGEVIATFGPQLLHEVNISPQAMAEVRKGMEQVTAPGGTAAGLFADFPPSLKIAAKTGTAQTGLARDDPRKDYHGVFVAFAPAANPEIALACLVEYGESGAGSAGRVAREVFRTYFNLNKNF